MRKIFLILSFILACTFSYANVVDSTGITTVNNVTYIQYLVEPSETIYGISTKYKVSIEDLMEINPQLQNGLKVGQIVLIPLLVNSTTAVKTEPVKKAEPIAPKEEKKEPIATEADRVEGDKTIHKVQPGETYYSLSKKYNTPVNELVSLNVPELKVGQEIVVKSTAKPVANITPQKEDKPDIIQEKTPAEDVDGLYENDVPKLLVIPFDPHLYWSDADMEIGKQSKLDMPRVRQAFRKRLSALLDPEGFQTIHLLGGKIKDSLTDLNKIYTSVTYEYKDVIYTQANPKPEPPKPDAKTQVKNGVNNTLNKAKNIFKKDEEEDDNQQPVYQNSSRAVHAKNPAKYFAVNVKDPQFYTYFNNKYKIDYYIFINQFEVETDYTECLDRARQNYKRNFVTHFSIFDKTGKQIAGHRIIVHYPSNSNNISQILKDNMETVAKRILAELPKRK